ncbi:MAG: TRAP transporter TatT component family protein [Pyrinomonadaceae bacterium]
MEHNDEFAIARKLIDERELSDQYLETAHDILADLIEQNPGCGWAYGLLSEIYYWSGENAEADEKMFYYGEGVSWGEQGVEADEDSVEANFWLAVNWGSFGQEKGIMKSLSLVTPIKETIEFVIEKDERFFYGGPWRVLGRLYHRAPGFPFSIGDNKKAEECLKRALELGPNFYLNHLFLAELYISEGRRMQAREELEWILNAEPNRNHEREDKGYKVMAAELLEKNL